MVKIINFHEVHNAHWFEKVIVHLKSNYAMISMDDIHMYYGKRNEWKKACHLTVDDGHKSFYKIIFPILKKHRVPVSLFISPKIILESTNYWFQEIHGYNQIELRKSIGDVLMIPTNALLQFKPIWILKTLKINQIHDIIRRYQCINSRAHKVCQNISVQQLIEVSKSDLVIIGGHTMNHVILKNEDDDTSRLEIKHSLHEVSNIVNRHTKYFAYPNGNPNMDFSIREENYLKDYGVDIAVTVNQQNLHTSDNKMQVPRFGILDNQHFCLIKAKLFIGNHCNIHQISKISEEVIQRNRFSKLECFPSM